MKFTDAFTKAIVDVTRGKSGIVNKTIYSLLSSRLEVNAITDVNLDEPFQSQLQNPYLQNPWVAISVRILVRAMQRAPFRIYKKSGAPLTTGPLAELFRRPGPGLSITKLWAQSMQYFWTEDEFFWWFGPRYRGGMPELIKVLRPADVELLVQGELKKWFYTDPDTSVRIEMKEGTFIHVYWPSLFNNHRGNPRLVSLFLQLEQDYLTTLGNTDALRNAAIPKGLLETEQRLTGDQIKSIIDMWSQRYAKGKGNAQIGVAANGTKFKPLNENLIKYLEFQDQIKVTVLTMYGIPLKVANATSEKTALSGKDSDEQYKAFWSQTVLPELRYICGELNAQAFPLFGFDGWWCDFDWKEIPELQVDEADEHTRIREDIKAKLITRNEGRAIIHMDPVEGGDSFDGETEKPKSNEGLKGFVRLVRSKNPIVLPIQRELFEEEPSATEN